MQPPLHERGDHEKHQCEPAEKNIVIFPVENFQNHYCDHQDPQNYIGGEQNRVLVNVVFHLLPGIPGVLAAFFFC